MEENQIRICVSLCSETVTELQQDVARAEEVADIIELRLDCLLKGVLDHELPAISSLVSSRRRPMILTLRPAIFGGSRTIYPREHLDFRMASQDLEQNADLWDYELELTEFYQSDHSTHTVDGWGCDWKRTICSHHDFERLPAALDQIYTRMAATGARILKVAIMAQDATDCLRVFELLQRAQNEKREMIAIAMGPAGIMTRILGPSRGSYLTYASLEESRETAPGQLTAKDLREVYRIDRIDQHTQIMGVVGLPLHHSLSPQIQNRALAALDLNAVYIPFEVRDVSSFLSRMVHPRTREIDWDLRGLSVTAPHKAAVMQHLDWLDPAADAIGAVNTILVRDDKLHGYNTDAAAFIESLRNAVGAPRGSRSAIIGCGGAASAVLWSLRSEGSTATVFARDHARGRVLAERFGAGYQTLEDASFNGFDVVVNATPLGTSGGFEAETPASAAQLRGARLAYDLVYNPIETLFMREAQAAGCETIGGLEMLVLQAAGQFKLWTGLEAPVSAMRAAALPAQT